MTSQNFLVLYYTQGLMWWCYLTPSEGWGNSTETQQLGHCPRFQLEVKMKEVVPEMVCRSIKLNRQVQCHSVCLNFVYALVY